MDTLGNLTSPIVMWTCDGTSTQKWNVAQLGGGLSMWGSVINGSTCLAADPNAVSSAIYQRDCGPHYPNTIWKG
jgi:hypothetical protein